MQPTSDAPQPLSTRFWLTLGAALVVAWLLFLRAFGPEGSSGELGPPELTLETGSRPADFNWPLLDLKGQPTSLAPFKGKAILLNIWATYCPPCLAEMPSLSNLAKDPRMKDVAVLCVSVDSDGETLNRWLEGKNLGMTILRAEGMAEAFPATGIPTTFLISPAGNIVGRVDGPAQWDHPKAVDALAAIARMKTD